MSSRLSGKAGRLVGAARRAARWPEADATDVLAAPESLRGQAGALHHRLEL
jgi:hypothetical protein